MNYGKHCNLCNHKKNILNLGSVCGLTNKKPSFKNTCSKIYFGSDFEEELELLCLEVEKIKNTKKETLLRVYIISLIGLILFFLGIFLLKFNTGSLYTYYYAYSFLGFGFSICWLGYNHLNRYRNKKRIAQEKKHDLDLLLKKYNVDYNYNVLFGQKHHGIQEVTINLEIKRKKTKKKSTTYQFNY